MRLFTAEIRCIPVSQSATLRIPVKWSADSGDVGQSRSEATLVVFYISEVDHMRSRKA